MTTPAAKGASTPKAVPGPRAIMLGNVVQGALMKTLRAVSYDNFATCFPTLAENIPRELRGVHGSMVGRLEELAKIEFDNLFEEKNIVASMNEFEGLIADAERRSKTGDVKAPNTYPPSEILAAHLAPHLISQQSQLNAKLQTTQSQNATLMEIYTNQRAEIDELARVLEGTVAELQGAIDGLEAVSGGLVDDMREIEAERDDFDEE